MVEHQPLTPLRALHRTLTYHPGTASRIARTIMGAMAGTAVVGMIVGAIIAPLAAPALLALVGFGSAGPIAGEFTFAMCCAERRIVIPSVSFDPQGSIAAGIQSMIGNVAAGSVFAAAQSVAMGGATTAAITAGAAISATVPPALKAASKKK